MSEETSIVRSHADVPTDHASRYLQQLCKHFAHKLPVTFDETAGRIEFTVGECRLEADEKTLRLLLAALGPDEMARLQDVVARHLVRFAFREEIPIEWRDA